MYVVLWRTNYTLTLDTTLAKNVPLGGSQNKVISLWYIRLMGVTPSANQWLIAPRNMYYHSIKSVAYPGLPYVVNLSNQ
jgi:hypothetical protein